jgi:hypothetical protein
MWYSYFDAPIITTVPAGDHAILDNNPNNLFVSNFFNNEVFGSSVEPETMALVWFDDEAMGGGAYYSFLLYYFLVKFELYPGNINDSLVD